MVVSLVQWEQVGYASVIGRKFHTIRNVEEWQSQGRRWLSTV